MMQALPSSSEGPTRSSGSPAWHRQTKDLDLFVLEDDWPIIEHALRQSGVDAHVEFSHWLAKATRGRRSRRSDLRRRQRLRPRGRRVDQPWHAGRRARLPRAYLSRRGNDLVEGVRHGARALRRRRRAAHHPPFRTRSRLEPAAPTLWRARQRAACAPAAVPVRVSGRDRSRARTGCSTTLWARRATPPSTADRVCRGTLLSRAQYLVDVHGWGYTDARLNRTAA